MSGKSIKHYFALSWLIQLGFAVATSAVLSLSLSYVGFVGDKHAQEERLHEAGSVIARRLAAELMLKDQGRVDSVRAALQDEFHLSSLELTQSNRLNLGKHSVGVIVPLPGIEPATWVSVSQSSPSFFGYINIRNFSFALVCIFGLSSFGFLLQRRLLKRFIIAPIEALAETSTGERCPDPSWPLEIRTIAQDLQDSFIEREKTIYFLVNRGVMHEIKTYLNPMATATELVEEATTDDKRNDRLSRLYSACREKLPKIHQIIERSLDTTRPVVVVPDTQDLNRTIDDSIRAVSEAARSKKVELTVSAEPGLKASHEAIQLEKALGNILNNAIEAAQDSKSQDRKVAITAIQTPHSVEIRIEDNGPGITDLRCIYRPFRSSKVHGHGVGLTISKKLIEEHKGQLVAGRSELLGGALFTLTFPKSEVSV